MEGVAVVVALAAWAVGTVRWTRVAQREHYIPGSCLVVARRWIAVRPPNAALAAAAAALVLASVGARLGDAPGAAAAAALVGSVASAAFPYPMTVRGREVRLKLTRRARTLLAVTVALAGLAAVGGALAGWLVPVAALLALAAPALVDLAAALAAPGERRALDRHRRRAAARLAQVGPRIVAVTGSWGKTSTKNHVRDLLAGRGEVLATPASWNNTAGLSRAVNEHMTDGCEVFVAEMGMYRPGEIRALCAWVRPEVAVITAVGPMHLERAGSLERIVEGKAEILERADQAVLWVGDDRLAALADRVAADGRRVWRVGPAGRPGLDVEVGVDGGEVVVASGGAEVGRYREDRGPHPGNVGCAVAAVLALGVPPAAVGPRLPALANPDHRVVAGRNEAGVLIVDDTFSSNPVGGRAAVAALARAVAGRRAVVTPGMVEMGPLQDVENRGLARAVVDSGATLVVVGWTNRRALVAGAGAGPVVLVQSRAEARDWVRAHLGEGDGALWESDLPDHYP